MSRCPCRSRAFTMLEILVATAIMTLVLFGSVSITRSGSRYFNGTAGAANTEADITNAARLVETTLAQCRDFEIASDGLSITYYNNDNAYPPKKDPTPHRFYLSGGNLMWTERLRPVLRGVPATDDYGPVQPFTPTGSWARDSNIVTVTLVTKRDFGAGAVTNRTRIRVIARNYQ